MKRFAKSAFGLLSLIIGVTILIWIAYSLVVPNEHFRLRLVDVPLLFLPLVSIWVGWSWLRGDSTQAKQYASELIVTLKLSDSDFGTGAERQAILALKHRLENVLRADQLAEIDGEEIQRFFSSQDSPPTFTLTQSQL
jgi:hypothetical protein